jgi:hypothetical protein
VSPQTEKASNTAAKATESTSSSSSVALLISSKSGAEANLAGTNGELVVQVVIVANTFPDGTIVEISLASAETQERLANGDLLSDIITINTDPPDLQPEKPFTLCFTKPANLPSSSKQSDGCNEKQVCLSSAKDEGGEWECNDNTLQEKQGPNGTVLLCGEITHFTSFALLLVASEEADCQKDDTFFWLSVAFLCGAVIVFGISVVLECYLKNRKRKRLSWFLNDRPKSTKKADSAS